MLPSQNHESLSNLGFLNFFNKTEGGSAQALAETIVLFFQPNKPFTKLMKHMENALAGQTPL